MFYKSSKDFEDFEEEEIIEEEETEEPKPLGHGFAYGILFIIGFIIVSSTFYFSVGYFSARKEIEIAEQMEPPCFVQFLYEHPYSIVVDNSEYMLEPSGKMSMETRTFLNPWHQEIINRGNCRRVDLVQPAVD